ncbi:MAG: hypothetical protein M0R06_15340 [Sphaerochaeta sp.]|jgi:hypothetical protein|nr:hypothetical protein [Sphaerochaeta sp.]
MSDSAIAILCNAIRHARMNTVPDGMLIDADDWAAIYDAMEAVTEEEGETCTWTEGPDGLFDTECGRMYQLLTVWPTQTMDEYRCPMCHKKIDIVPYKEKEPER